MVKIGWAVIGVLSVLGISIALLLEDDGMWCERALKAHPFPTLKEALLDNCKTAEERAQKGKSVDALMYCDKKGTLLMLTNLTTSLQLVKEWTKYCTQQALLSYKKGVPFENQTGGIMYRVNNLMNNESLFVSSEGYAVSRRRRSLLIQSHGPGNNKWLKLAYHTASRTGVDTPCWVCSFRPHHSQDHPTSAAIPLNLTELMCTLHQWNVDLSQNG